MRRTNASKASNQLASNLLSKASDLSNRVFKAQSIHFYRLLGVALFLTVFGIVMVLSASSIDSLKANNNSFTIGAKQLFFAVVGFGFLSMFSLVKTSTMQKRSKIFFQLALATQVAVLFIGKSINGNRNWLDFGLFSIQPSEFLKIAIILYGAFYLAQRADYFYDGKVWVMTLLWGGLGMAFVIAGSDLGTVIIMFLFYVGMLVMAGMPSRLIGAILAALVVIIPLAVNFGSSSRVGRILAWMNPNAPDPNGYNWQSEHGMWALSAGRIFGAGLGESKMKWSWIPEVENDFIFAIIGEELGLIGALVIIGMFLFMAVCFNNILRRTSDLFSRYVVAGVMLWITLQALVNIAVVLRLLPVLGVPLPFVSAGGSSLLSSLMGVGLVLAIERENHASPAQRARTVARPVRSTR